MVVDRSFQGYLVDAVDKTPGVANCFDSCLVSPAEIQPKLHFGSWIRIVVPVAKDGGVPLPRQTLL